MDVYASGEYFLSQYSALRQAGGDIFDIASTARKAYNALLLAKQLGLPCTKDTRIVEIGCGHGVALFPIESTCPAQITGVDIATVAIEAAQQHAEEIGSRIRFLVGSIDTAPDADWYFLFDVLEHVENPYEWLHNLHNKGHYCFIHTPIEHSWGHLILNRPMSSYRIDKHLHYWSWLTFRIMVEHCGYEIVAHRFDAGRNAQWKQGFRERLGGYVHRAFPRIAPWLAGGPVNVVLRPV
jgi:SAM-dependent methyltransferase